MLAPVLTIGGMHTRMYPGDPRGSNVRPVSYATPHAPCEPRAPAKWEMTNDKFQTNIKTVM